MSEEQILVREFQAEFAQVGDGRTVDVRVVPYNTPTEVSDFGGPTYRESWKPGVFDHQAKAANRVWLSFEHEQGLRGVIGHGVELVSREDGFYGSFRVLDGSDGDKALQMLDKKLLPGVSLEAIPHRSEKTPDGIVERIKATLKAVSLVRFPAFKEAQVLAVREGELPDEPDPAELTPDEPVPDPEPEGEPVPAARQFTHEEVEAVAASLERRSRVDELLERVGYEPIVKRALERLGCAFHRRAVPALLSHRPWWRCAAKDPLFSAGARAEWRRKRQRARRGCGAAQPVDRRDGCSKGSGSTQTQALLQPGFDATAAFGDGNGRPRLVSSPKKAHPVCVR